MEKIHALVGASNYSGSWRVYQSKQDGERFVAYLKNIGIDMQNIKTLFDHQYSRANVLRELANLSKHVLDGGCAIIYFAGHGTQIGDRDGEEVDHLDEALQTDDRQLVTDDEITTPFVGRNIRVITIADTCHSPSLDMWRFAGSPTQAVSIKAAQDYQSALQSGDGSYMSSFLFSILAENGSLTVRELQQALDTNMRMGFAGNMQLCKVEVSDNALWNESLFG